MPDAAAAAAAAGSMQYLSLYAWSPTLRNSVARTNQTVVRQRIVNARRTGAGRIDLSGAPDRIGIIHT